MSVKYTIAVTYGPHSRPLQDQAVPPGGAQHHQHLGTDTAREAAEAFLRDLFQFHGAGVSSVTVTAEREEGGD